MATNFLQRAFASFFNTITYSFIPFHDHNHHHNRGSIHHNFHRKTMPKPRPLSLQTVELKVRMCCAGCERVVKNAISKLRGVDSIEVDLKMEKVTVIGYVDRNKVLKAVRRSDKRAEFWPYPNPPLYFTSANEYFRDTTHEFKESYNYWRHGYNLADRRGTVHITHRGDDKVSNMFNDDNVNAACSIM